MSPAFKPRKTGPVGAKYVKETLVIDSFERLSVEINATKVVCPELLSFVTDSARRVGTGTGSQ